MGYSVHIRIGRGLLKIKNSRRVRSSERVAPVKIWRIGDMCLVWIPQADSSAARPSDADERE